VSAHLERCIICGAEFSCYDDAHALGCGECCFRRLDGTLEVPQKGAEISFCSWECFEELERRMAERRRFVESSGSDIRPRQKRALPYGGDE